MADEVIGRADYELRAKIDGLKQDLAAAEGELAKSGDRGEAAFAQKSAKWAPVIAEGVKTGVKVVGAGAAAMFAIASKGADELRQVQNDYQSETGASAEEAKRAGQVINKVAGENQKSLESVSAAAIAVHNDLGLAGDQADDVLARMVRFARVTKQEPVAAVKAFDDILDAWNLTAADSQKVMDALVVSHEKYGGSVSDDQAALAGLAPTLRAMNGTWQDAVALLDLAKASGLDTADAITGLNKALGKVKSPEELQRLIDDISNTADPFLRAQKAADLFGQKAGPKLANALAGKHLQDFAIDMNAAAGATDKAAEALDQGFGGQARKMLSEFGATLRGLGDDWGPVLTGAAGFASLAGALGVDTIAAKLGPKFVAAMAAAGKQGGEALVDAAGTATGALGTIIGNNISNRVEAIFAPTTETVLGRAWRRLASSRDFLAPVWGPVAAKLRPVILAAGLESGITFGGGMAEGAAGAETIAAMEASGAAAGRAFGLAAAAAALLIPVVAAPGMHQGANDALGLPEDADQNARNKAILDRFDKAMGKAGTEAGQAFTDAAGTEIHDGFAPAVVQAITRDHGWEAAGRQIVGAVRDGAAAEAPRTAASIGHTLADEMKSHGGAWIASAHKAGERAMEGIAQGIFDARQKVVDAFDTLKELLKHPMGTLQEQARLAGELTGKMLAKGLHSNDEGIRDFSRSAKQYALDQLTALAAKSGHISAKASAAIEAGLKSKNATIRKNSADAKLAYLAGLQQYVERGGKLSKDAAAAVERGIKSKNSQIHKAALHIKELATKPLEQAKNGAHADGQNVAEQFAAGLSSAYALRVITQAALRAAHAADSFLHGASPPPKGPLHTIDEGGENVTLAWAKGLARGRHHVASAGEVLAAQLKAILRADPMAAGYAASAGYFAGTHSPWVTAGGAVRTPATTNHYGGNVTVGDVHLHGVGSDVSPAAADAFAARFRQRVMDSWADGIRGQAARTSRVTAARW